jgi:hypothetical protein
MNHYQQTMMGKQLNDLTGSRYGALVALRLGEKHRKATGAWWMCACDCGAVKHLPSCDLVAGKISSCGCQHQQRIAQASKTHGRSKSRTYKLWMAMRNRCNRINQDYSARGITYDKRWDSFENFLADMGEAADGMSLDRIDVNGNYHKENCRWATREQQANNTRANVFLEHNGKRQTVTQWAKELGMKPDKLRSRLRYGWSTERALAEGNTPTPADEPAQD